jgi:isopenicillin-N epimerase
VSQDETAASAESREDEEARWAPWRNAWSLREDVVYLNHGSFGPAPNVVQAEQQRFAALCQSQPMDFFVRRYDELLWSVRERLGAFIGARPEDLVLVDNATMAMNVVANSVALAAGDEVLLNDHEYGAVERIWRRACEGAGAKLVVASVPVPLNDPAQVVEAVFGHVTERTRLLVVSHVTSPTAIVFPVAEICARARQRGIATCIDGPHALAMLPLDLARLDCDYYLASCHKWLSAPFGSGFLWARSEVQPQVRPPHLSWGRTPAGREPSWRDEFDWVGTRDISAWLAISAAITVMERLLAAGFRRRTHALAAYARRKIEALTGLPGLTPDDPAWYGSMAAMPLPPGQAELLQAALWQRHRIEVPIVAWQGQRLVRVSCHAYTQSREIDQLVDAVGGLLAEGL